MAVDTLYARDTDIVTASATLSLTSGTTNGSFPLTNLQDKRPDTAWKATGTSATIRATFGGSQALQAIALANHNLHGLTLAVTNNGGMASQNLVVPAVGEDALPINPWLDLRSVASASGTQWNIAISGAAANCAIGELLLIATARTMPMLWGVTVDEDQPVIRHRTGYKVPLTFGLAVRIRTVRGRLLLESGRAAMVSLFRAQGGARLPWWLVLDSTVNDSLYVQFQDDSRLSYERRTALQSGLAIDAVEMCAGVAL